MNLLVLANTNDSFNSVRPEAEIYVSLAKYGYNITIMTQKDGGYTSRFLDNNIDVVDTNFSKKISIKTISKIKSIIKSKNINIVYATNSKAISNATIACIGIKVKLITYRGTTGGLYRHDPSSYFNALSPVVDGIICVSNSVKKHVDKQVFSSRKKIQTIYKGHKLDWYKQKKLDLKEFDTNTNNFNIAFVANVRPHKGLIFVLQAAAKLAKIKDIHILLIGQQISQEPYIYEILNSGMKDRIHITGYRDDAPDIIAACDVLIHASIRKEGLPRVILESLASATPVIASSNESSLEIIEDGINGYITPIKNADAIAQKVKLLHSNPDILKKLSENCELSIKTKMAHDTTVKKYMEYFKSL